MPQILAMRGYERSRMNVKFFNDLIVPFRIDFRVNPNGIPVGCCHFTILITLFALLIPHPLILCEFLLLSFSVWLRVRSRELTGRSLRAPHFVKQKNTGQKFIQPNRVRYIKIFHLALTDFPFLAPGHGNTS